MNMDFKDKNKSEWKRLISSFSFAANGIFNAYTKERNLQIHLFLSVIVIAAGLFFNISRSEWIIIIILIGGMLTLELMNTAIERLVDLVTLEYHPLAKLAKDISAGAVLTFALTAVIVGILIFLQYILEMI